MDLTKALDIFRKGIAMVGSVDISPGMFDCPAPVLVEILKKGFRPVNHDLVMLVSGLMGYGSKNVQKVMLSIISFSEGKMPRFDDSLFLGSGLNCLVIKVYADGYLTRLCNTISLLSDDGGETWVGSVKGIVRTFRLTAWVKMYYNSFLEALAYARNKASFDIDFRFVAAYKPSGGTFVPFEIFQVDTRPLEEIKDECMKVYGNGDIAPTYTVVDSNKQPKVKPPPRPPKSYPIRIKSNPKPESPKTSPRRSQKRSLEDEEKQQLQKKPKTDE